MLQNIEKILNSGKNDIQTVNKQFREVVKGYNFLYFSQNGIFRKIQPISQNIKDSKIMVINYSQNQTPDLDDLHFIIGFKNTIMVIHSSSLNQIIKYIFSQNELIEIIFLPGDAKKIFDQNITIGYKESTNLGNTDEFINELHSFKRHLNLSVSEKNQEKIQIWEIVIPCISGYLIKQSYSKLNVNRLDNFNKELIKIADNDLFDKENYIELRNIGGGSLFIIKLMYDIENERFLIIKTPSFLSEDNEKLLLREEENYQNILLPFIPEYYGTINNEDAKWQIIEFINGNTLKDIQKYHFSFKEKAIIIFEILILFSVLHSKKFVYRDLKPDNVMIDQNNNIVLIDFDRMVKIPDYFKDNSKYTFNFETVYIAPEALEGKISDKNDIYSIGQLIYFITKEKNPDSEMIIEEEFENQHKLFSIYKQCINIDMNKRPSIDQLLLMFFNDFCSLINDKFLYLIDKILYYQYNTSIEVIFSKYISDRKDLNENETITFNFEKFNEIIEYWVNLPGGKNKKELINKTIDYLHLAADKNDPSAQNNLGMIYYKGKYIKQDIDQSIRYFTLAADQNYPEAQLSLGVVYQTGKYVTRDINKSIYFYSLAAKQNLSYAQINLGLLYYKGEYIKQDINKAIYYFTLAANQNNPEAQNILGAIYCEGKYIKQDIDKGFHYFNLAADQNYPEAQNNLGTIYYEGKYIKQDINKAIYYYSLAADQNHPIAQNSLATIYSDGKYIPEDLKKAIHYYQLAADQNCSEAQYNLATIYSSDKYITQYINKAIYYYSLAADQNNPDALFNLGIIYLEGKYVKRDVNKSIHCFTLASNQNHSESQNNLGIIYSDGKYIKMDIQKSIYYFSLAARQNHSEAQFNLGVIYSNYQYNTLDINKAIFYYSLAANQNNPKAQFNLGKIYYEGKNITIDSNKAIHYYSLAANQNIPEAQISLGIIYYEGKYIKRDINKSIHYLSLAANQNHPVAQFSLGHIYYEGKYTIRDINKAIHYLTLSANQNKSEAQNYLGFIYLNSQYIKRDINKSIHYYTLAANQNYPEAQFNLGVIYYKGKYIKRNINKAIHYYSLSANQNFPEAQLSLGLIYYDGEYIKRDINKSIHYLSLAAIQNIPEAQLSLGLIYYKGKYTQKDIIKGQNYIIKSSKNGLKEGNFSHGFLLHEGRYIERNIKEAIYYYKEASSFNNQYAKNNLGIIYKNGFGDEIEENIGHAIGYFDEAIHQKNDYLAMYNLAHIYIYNEEGKLQNINKSIQLLIESSNNLGGSLFLLCLILVKKFCSDMMKIEQEIRKFIDTKSNIRSEINRIIYTYNLFDKTIFDFYYEEFKTIDFLYDVELTPVISSTINNIKTDLNFSKYPNSNNISSEFYEGFGNDLLN